MGDALARDLVKFLMQGDRIRRSQRTVNGALLRHQADGADAGCFATEQLPDLSRESGHGGFAAGPGNGRDRCRLPRIEFGRRQRQRSPWIGRGDERHSAGLWRMMAGHRHRAAGNRLVDEARAIGLAAGQREKQVAGLDGAAVGRKSRHLGRIRARIERGVAAEQVAEPHDVPARQAQRPGLRNSRSIAALSAELRKRRQLQM